MTRTTEDVAGGAPGSQGEERELSQDEKISKLAKLSEELKKKELSLAKAQDRVNELTNECVEMRTEIAKYLK